MTICDKILLRLGIQRIIHDLVSIPSGSLPAQPRVLMFGSGVRLHWPVPHFLLLVLGSGCTGCTRYVNNFGISSGCTGPFLLIFGSGGSARNGYVDLFGFSSSFWVRHKTRERTTVRPAMRMPLQARVTGVVTVESTTLTSISWGFQIPRAVGEYG